MFYLWLFLAWVNNPYLFTISYPAAFLLAVACLMSLSKLAKALTAFNCLSKDVLIAVSSTVA